ncbi:hypothetical protein TELCIR_25326 [Teladorsagia circumcincta]|uniref:Uncharacterized protein n=1 Tax=Teladorsagia circumcincta TaxID=45464 RepID=A0A2G9T5X1_TELCI|nr:hypothetical protein TELCIR_25326 [Teladorsagia circumcincta]
MPLMRMMQSCNFKLLLKTPLRIQSYVQATFMAFLSLTTLVNKTTDRLIVV